MVFHDFPTKSLSEAAKPLPNNRPIPRAVRGIGLQRLVDHTEASFDPQGNGGFVQEIFETPSKCGECNKHGG